MKFNQQFLGSLHEVQSSKNDFFNFGLLKDSSFYYSLIYREFFTFSFMKYGKNSRTAYEMKNGSIS